MDSLNAEVSLGTVANIRDAVQWLGYTYLFVRMRMNPFVYGERPYLHQSLLQWHANHTSLIIPGFM